MHSWMKFFFFTGSSLKCYFDKSLPSKIISISLISFYILNIISAVIITISFTNLSPIPSKLFFTVFLYWSSWFCSLIIVLSTITKANVEAKFWETLSDLEYVFKGKKFSYGNFNKIFGLKVIFLSSFFVSKIPKSFDENQIGVSIKSIIVPFIFRIVLHTLLIKYIFYVDVLQVCLRNIENELKETKNSTFVDFKTLEKSYKLSYDLSLMIEEIFGWSIISFIFTRLGSSVYHGYVMFNNFVKGNVTFSLVAPLLMNFMELWMATNSCENCVETSKSIASLALSINLKEFHKIIADFVLQMLHQRIKFQPKSFLVVNHRLIVKVSMTFDE